MSGGHFEYKCFDVGRFAEMLRHELEINDSDDQTEWGEFIGYKFDVETVNILTECMEFIEKAGKIAREVEWLYSGDHGEDNFREIIRSIL